MISAADLELFQFADDPQTALRLVQEGLTPQPEAETEKPAFAHSRSERPGRGTQR
jgi:hypothetical protein